MFHPGAARIDCADCCRKVYDLETGEPVRIKVQGVEVEYGGGPGHKPPCKRGEECPKGTLETAHESELSPRNAEAFRFYHLVRATHGAVMQKQHRRDRLLLEKLATCESIMRAFERSTSADKIATVMSTSLAGLVLKH